DRRSVRAGVPVLVPEPEISLQTCVVVTTAVVRRDGRGNRRNGRFRRRVDRPPGGGGRRTGEDTRAEHGRGAAAARAGHGRFGRTRNLADRSDPHRAGPDGSLPCRVRSRGGTHGRCTGPRYRRRAAPITGSGGRAAELAGGDPGPVRLAAAIAGGPRETGFVGSTLGRARPHPYRISDDDGYRSRRTGGA